MNQPATPPAEQLALFGSFSLLAPALPVAPPAAPAVPASATRLLWEAAGRPRNTTGKDGVVDAQQAPGARCWWCGHAAPDGWARPRSVLPDTFPWPLEAAVPESEWLCLPCGWTLCDRVALPIEQAGDKIRARAAKGSRLIVSLRGAPAERYLALELADGTVGLWTPAAGKGAAEAEEPWLAAVAELRVTPTDVGVCRFIEAVPYDALAPEATEKWRSYHHLATADRWWPCTNADKAGIRAWLLDPPAPPWVAVITDGQKHFGIEAQRLDAITTAAELCVVLFLGAVVVYEPAALAALLGAVEGLVRAGASDDEITAGAYAPRGLDLHLALRRDEPVVAPYRGGATLALALYLRRSRKELDG